jgi:DNA-binding SARP family transcriptional activator
LEQFLHVNRTIKRLFYLQWYEMASARRNPLSDYELPAKMSLECLGQFRLSDLRSSQRVASWTSHCADRAGVYKVQALLAYLTHVGRRGTTRNTLNQLLWGRKASTATIGRTIGALSAVLSELFGATFVEEHLLINGDHLSLNPDCYRTDAQQFLELYEQAEWREHERGRAAAAPLYEQARRLYGGPYMIAIPHSGYWCAERRDQLAGTFVNICERLAEQSFTERRYKSCITLCQQALDVEDTADDIVCWLLRAFHALDLRAEFEHSYKLYLRAIAASGDQGESDQVSRTFQSLRRSRAISEG